MRIHSQAARLVVGFTFLAWLLSTAYAPIALAGPRVQSGAEIQAQAMFQTLAQEPMEEVWIDPETVRGALEATRGWLGDRGVEQISSNLVGAKLLRRKKDLRITLFLEQALDIQFKDFDDTETGQPYGLHIPKVTHVFVRQDGEVLQLHGFGNTWDSLGILVNFPMFPDEITLERVAINLGTFAARVEARILAGMILVVGEAELKDGKPQVGVNFWDTLLRNLVFWPAIRFRLF